MTEEAAMRQAILTEPDDHVHRLVLADWLQEHDDPRESIVRAQGMLGPSLQLVEGLRLVPIPSGTFTMGSPDDELGRDADEPAHEVQITKAFYLGATPVTVGQYRAFVQATEVARDDTHRSIGYGWNADRQDWEYGDYGWRTPGWKQGDDHPVTGVSWHDAVAFCQWLSDRDEGHTYRLPTEAEWEYACRAWTTTPFACGDELSSDDANYDTRYPYDPAIRGTTWRARTTPVRTFPANAFGLYDLHGNVWEWCADWYDAEYYGRSAKRDPKGPRDGSGHVLRGGAWCVGAAHCRSALRRCGERFFSRYQDGATGFRVALSMPAAQKRRRKPR